MKLRNLFFALLLAVGAIGFTACTGDDGDAGPAGPPGEQGEQGPPGEDAGDLEYGYGFLTNWGKPSGSMSCSDDVLNTMGVFPGPDLTAIPAAQNAARMAAAANSEATANGYVQVACSDGTANSVFNDAPNPDFTGDDVGDLTGYTASRGLLFVKTERGMEMSSDRTEATTSSPALATTVTKTFSGGYVYANVDVRGGSDEGIQRDRLHHVCQVGSTPPSIVGHFRAVTIVDESKNVRLSNTGDTRGLQEDIPNTTVTKTTKKVCVRLDSLPGVVKCYVKNIVAVPGTPAGNAVGVMANAGTDTIGIYNADGTLTPVMPAAAAAGATNPGQVGPVNAADDVQFIGNANDFQGAKLCNLFAEAAPGF